MSPVSQRSLGCTGMRHLEQLGLETEETPGAQLDEMERGMEGGILGWGGCRVRMKRGLRGLITRRAKMETNTCTHQRESQKQRECDFYLYQGHA